MAAQASRRTLPHRSFEEEESDETPTGQHLPAERVARIVVGAAGAVAGTLLLASAGAAVVVVLEVALLLAGLDLVVTGALGFCPLYHRLGHTPRALGRQA